MCSESARLERLGAVFGWRNGAESSFYLVKFIIIIRLPGSVEVA